VDGWVTIDRWPECARMARPGYIFEIRNAADQRLLTHCVVPLPSTPFDWKSAPKEFRLVPEPAPRRSSPIPEPSPSKGQSGSR
jgi:hypothetical protein